MRYERASYLVLIRLGPGGRIDLTPRAHIMSQEKGENGFTLCGLRNTAGDQDRRGQPVCRHCAARADRIDKVPR